MEMSAEAIREIVALGFQDRSIPATIRAWARNTKTEKERATLSHLADHIDMRNEMLDTLASVDLTIAQLRTA